VVMLAGGSQCAGGPGVGGQVELRVMGLVGRQAGSGPPVPSVYHVMEKPSTGKELGC
jgi:hypothetical protein